MGFDFCHLRCQIEQFGVKNILENENLAQHSTFRIGGPAKLMIFPTDCDQLVKVAQTVSEAGGKYIVIGNGSNLLFDDKGYDGVVISTCNMRHMTIKDDIIEAFCGASFTAMATAAARAELSGLEFAYGIPGSCGGAVFMNAGAYGAETSDVIQHADCYDMSCGEVVRFDRNEMDMSYRHSLFMHRPELIILSASFRLDHSDKDCIMDVMKRNMNQRREKQPLEYPNAGSIFKRHGEYFIGKIIDDSGLKGYSIGGAQVSEKHAGFIVNRGGATSADVLNLISHIKAVILKNYGFEPECEIRYIH